MKKCFIIPAVLVVLLAGAAAVLLLSLNSIIIREVNSIGSELTGTAVNLEKADVSLFAGTGVFTKLTIGNPKGFSSTPALSIGAVNMKIVPHSILDDTVIIPKIEIDRPEILYELAKGTSNIETILAHAGSAHIAEKKNPVSGETQLDSSIDAQNKHKKKVIIDELIIRNAKATLLVPMPKISVSVPLPQIRLTGIGRDGMSVTAAQCAVIILKEIKDSLKSATVTFRDVQLKEAKDTLLHMGRPTEEKAKKLLKKGLNLLKQ